jgi:ribonuclease R
MKTKAKEHDPIAALAKKIQEILKQAPETGISRSELKRRLSHPVAAPALREALQRLADDGLLGKSDDGQLRLGVPGRDSVAGKLFVHPRGFGFVTPDGGGDDIFIPARGLHHGMSSDRVQVKIEAPESAESRYRRGRKNDAPLGAPKGPAGTITKIIERGVERIIGKLVKIGPDYQVRPLRRELPDAIPVVSDKKKHIHLHDWLNHWVEASLIHPVGHERLECQLEKNISPEDSILGDLHAIIAEYKLQAPYSEDDLALAAAAKPIEVPGRLDCRKLKPVTIDPIDAKDHDDAISVEPGKKPGTLRVGIHIADVAAYIHPGSYLDQQAAIRCFTSYLPGLTLPMLPHPLAAVQCSLIANQDRLAHSVFIEVDTKTGAILSSVRHRTTIRVWHRLNHEETDAFIATGETPETWPRGLGKAIQSLYDLSVTMRARRAKEEEFLSLEIPEIRVMTQGMPPKITGLKVCRGGPASELVEEYMLAGNEAVAKELVEKNIPGLFRVHAEPAEEALALFSKSINESYGMKIPPLKTRHSINRFMDHVTKPELREILSIALLGNLPRAGYAAAAALHYGLGKTHYSHFTSPIRRYADTVVHQQLLARDLGLPERDHGQCAEVAAAICMAEKNNDDASFAATDRLKVRYLHHRLEQEGGDGKHDGVISRIVGDALLVYINELGFYGTVPFRLLVNDYYEIDSGGKGITGQRTGKRYRCGDVLSVQVAESDLVKGRVLLRPVRPPR